MDFRPAQKTPRFHAAHDRELLGRLIAHGKPATLAGLFGGQEPKWATDSLQRLLGDGLVSTDQRSEFEVTAAGKKWFGR